jgi:biopolymer transport protein ExbB
MQYIEFFFAHTDALGATLFCLLALMSLLSWGCILAKSFTLWQLFRQGRRFRREFCGGSERAAAEGNHPFARLARTSFEVHEEVQRTAKGKEEELLLRCMNRVMGEEGARLDSGQTLLATVAAVAPFVGLFGTVWGVHNALVAIGNAGAASLDQIAGPVGEALIMTALGLAVAIPALLAYNAFSRSTQHLLAQLDALAHDLHHYLSTGQALPASVREG